MLSAKPVAISVIANGTQSLHIGKHHTKTGYSFKVFKETEASVTIAAGIFFQDQVQISSFNSHLLPHGNVPNFHLIVKFHGSSDWALHCESQRS